MAVLRDVELGADPGRVTGRKARGLALLTGHGIATPEFIVLDDREFQAWTETRRLTPAVREGVADLLARTVARGAPALFSMRCEATSAATGVRPPPTILNIGHARFVADGAGAAGLALTTAALAATYEQRIAAFAHRHGPVGVIDTGDVLATIHAWIARMFQALEPVAGSCGSRELVVQRMVFGCADERSGNGICCNFPEHAGGERFRGVFLPGQQGIPTLRGAWGRPQVDLDELARISPGAHRDLAQTFERLERLAPDPYLEFTVESSRLYCLQYEQRRRHVALT